MTRLSLGIENFDDEILRSNGRAHLSKEIHRAYEFARSIGFKQINIDLIAGMLNETEANWRECVRKAIELAADCVTVYQMEIPFNTTIYQEMHEQGEIVAPVADWPTKRAWVDYAFTELEGAGYTVTSAYTAVRNPQPSASSTAITSGKAPTWWPWACPPSAISAARTTRTKRTSSPMSIACSGELPIHRGLGMTEEEKLIREVILQMKLGHLERAYFREKFAIDILTRFARPLDRLRQSGYVSIDADGVLVARPGLLRVDELLHEFFLPQHQHARYT